jgi:hypothetical protein
MDSGQISEGKNPRIMKIQLGGMEGFVMPGCSGQRPFFKFLILYNNKKSFFFILFTKMTKLGIDFCATVSVLGTVNIVINPVRGHKNVSYFRSR